MRVAIAALAIGLACAPAAAQYLDLSTPVTEIDFGADPLAESLVNELGRAAAMRRSAAERLDDGPAADALRASAGARQLAADLLVRALERGPRDGATLALAALQINDGLDRLYDCLRRAAESPQRTAADLASLAERLSRPLPDRIENVDHVLRSRLAPLLPLLEHMGESVASPWISPTLAADASLMAARIEGPHHLALNGPDRARLAEVLEAMRRADGLPAFRPRARALLLELSRVVDDAEALEASPFLGEGDVQARREVVAEAFADLLWREKRDGARASLDLLAAQARLENVCIELHRRGASTETLSAIAKAWNEALWPAPQDAPSAEQALSVAIRLLEAEVERCDLPEPHELDRVVRPTWTAVIPAMNAGGAAGLDLALRLANDHGLANTPAPVALLQNRERASRMLAALAAVPALLERLFEERTPIRMEAADRCRELLATLKREPRNEAALEELARITEAGALLERMPFEAGAGPGSGALDGISDLAADLRGESLKLIAERGSLDEVRARHDIIRRAAEVDALAGRLDALLLDDSAALAWPGWRLTENVVRRTQSAAAEATRQAVGQLKARRFDGAEQILDEFDRLWADARLIDRVATVLEESAAAKGDPLVALAIPPDRYALLVDRRADLALVSWIWAEEMHDLEKSGRLGPHLRRRASSAARGALDDLPPAGAGG